MNQVLNQNSRFLTKQNINLLWDVLLDELHIDSNNKSIVTNIRTVFESNINPFTKNVNQNAQLVILNKQFLSQVLIAVNRLFPNLKQEQEFKRIQISSEEASVPYKIEDIRESRQTDFEKQVNLKRADFENSINLNKPKELDFSEKIDDGKILEMDALIAETVARRKFDIEQIQHTVVSEDAENWLQPQQREPLQPHLEPHLEPQQSRLEPNKTTNTRLTPLEKTSSNSDLSIYRKLKLKQPEENVVITNPIKKNVTWTDQMPNTNINNNNNNISLLIEEFSFPLKKEKIDILTDKVDILIDLMTKLTKQLSEPLAKQLSEPLAKQLGDKQLGDNQLDNESN
jgi:hypothetical protein